MPEHKNDAEIEGLVGQVSASKVHLQGLEERLERLRNERASDLAPFKRGNRVMYRGKQYEISSVVERYRVTRYLARNVLKNGQTGSREHQLFNEQEITTVTPE